jgi:16S rRNA (guanine966-N2)-methyltransferase
MLIHAPWGGRDVIDGARVLDVFAGTGALGLEALSRGAASCIFIENDAAALKALRANIGACGLTSAVARVVVADATVRPGQALEGQASLVFLDPPYGRGLVPLALAAQAARIAADALVVVETGRDEAWLPSEDEVLDERRHGAARVVIFRKR